jgi:hypothetical protein
MKKTNTWATIATVSFWVAIIGGSTYFFNKALFFALIAFLGFLLSAGLLVLLVALSHILFQWLFSLIDR